MTRGAVEVITSVERRRRWSAAEKEQLIAATLEPGGSVSAVARAAGMHPSQLYGWRRQLCAQPRVAPGFTPVRVAGEPASVALSGAGQIDIEFASGARMRITGAVDAPTVTAAVAALAGGRRR
jgi:transposase